MEITPNNYKIIANKYHSKLIWYLLYKKSSENNDINDYNNYLWEEDKKAFCTRPCPLSVLEKCQCIYLAFHFSNQGAYLTFFPGRLEDRTRAGRFFIRTLIYGLKKQK